MTIGHEPIIETLVLVPGQDFIHDIYPPDGASIPPGTTVDLIFYATGSRAVLATWSASVSASAASWTVSSTVADTIPLPADFRIYFRYNDGADFCWYRGQVARQE
ncbi:hypothetical protein ACFXG4_03500 [Nocardia sp. NPDC059246]|uniref:LtfC-like domain-containing protein n=1 Tax=unclassified Nocardia TaxID=2637762 RepID=UPI00369D6CFD